ncbi:MAG: hypothetical protein ACHREM_12330 [Polyangiales bacterium]
MRTTLFLSTVALLALSACGIETGSTPAPSLSSIQSSSVHRPVAQAALGTFARIADRRPASMGFAAKGEAAAGVLGEPLPMFRVGLGELRDFAVGVDPHTLLEDLGSALYPVMIDGGARSSIVVEKDGADWKATRFGSANLAHAAHATRTRVSGERSIEASSTSLVEIPMLSVRLLAHDEGRVLMLTPLFDVPGTDLRANETRLATEVFDALRPIALAVNENVPN